MYRYLSKAVTRVRWLSVLVGLAVGFATVTAIVWLLGPATLFVAGDAVTVLAGKERVDAINSVRQTLISAVTGVVALGAVVMAVRTYVLTRRGQHADRYAKAIALLASEKLAERIGGVYALEHVMRDSAKDQRTVVDVLAAFVRESAPIQLEHDDGSDRSTKPVTDVHAAVIVLGRRPRSAASVPIDLTATDLRGARLEGVRLSGAVFDGSQLDGAVLSEADLRAASLRGATLVDADLTGVDLTRADLVGADLSGAQLGRARLREATLIQARLDNVTAFGADLTEADLHSASAVGADLAGADLRGAKIADVEGLGHSRTETSPDE
ncbi:pentapeptide repeat-containing protein [Amycolatopsis sp. NPDC058278]|uniref:pentapeptide repeat-containing protein n=1 Tax=Amycolatopsis sp. NPDC058278 TaxID=3346417 RepID=UPI0036DA856D